MLTSDEAIRQRITKLGRITFAEYMELALYGPGGYYTTQRAATRDYYTSPSAHPAFGALLALQLEQMWHQLDQPASFHAVEIGAGDGTLARDLSSFSAHLDRGFASALNYTAIDRGRPCPASLPTDIHWAHSDPLPSASIIGCIFSNEAVDAMPVHRVTLKHGKLQEVFLTIRNGQITEELDIPSSDQLASHLEAETANLKEGWEVEINLNAFCWMKSLGQSLKRGYVVTIDYGDLADLIYSPNRARGTITTYSKHAQLIDPYASPGTRDITSHANFTTLKRAGESVGLTPIALTTQRRFLLNVGLQPFINAMRTRPMPAQERQANLMGLRELIKPEGLGGFRVLFQTKGAPVHGLGGLDGGGSFAEAFGQRLALLPLPLLGSHHINMLTARYPYVSENWDELL